MWRRFLFVVGVIAALVAAQAPTNETFTAPTSVPYPRGPKPDSEGTEFIFTFTRNAHFDVLPYIALDYINQDEYATAKVVVEVIATNHFAQKITPEVAFVPPKRSFRHVLASSSYIWGNLNDGLQRHPNTALRITASTPIRVYGINQDVSTYQADVTTILPTTMAGKNYVITVPSAARKTYGSLQYHVIYFLPANASQSIDIQTTMINEQGVKSVASTTINDRNYVSYIAQTATVNRTPRTYFITASAPISVVAAVTCTDVISGNPDSGCDYAAFMPPPIYEQACDELGYSLYGADTYNTAHFYVAPPLWNCNNNNVASYFYVTQKDGAVDTHQENSQSFQHRLKVATMDVIGIQSDQAVLQFSRLGGVDIGPSQKKIGAFLTYVPSAAQLITGVHYFYLPSTIGILEVTSDTPQIVVDGNTVNYITSIQNPLGTWYTFQYNITNPYSEHFVYSNGYFSATLIGFLKDNAYGFELAYNKLKPGAPYSFTTTASTSASASSTSTTPKPQDNGSINSGSSSQPIITSTLKDRDNNVSAKEISFTLIVATIFATILLHS